MPTVSVVSTQTAETTETPNYRTPIVATHEAYATRVREFREALRTSVALTHAPTETPGRPPAYPTPTPMLGMLPGCSNTSPYGPQAISCWRGLIDGAVVEVAAGMEGLEGDPQQGIIKVHVRGEEGSDIYETPERAGAVRIVSVDDEEMVVTLETIHQPTPQQFVFDLESREWVSP
jgi:hypothetical protein